jgi:hypothetical protein
LLGKWLDTLVTETSIMDAAVARQGAAREPKQAIVRSMIARDIRVLGVVARQVVHVRNTPADIDGWFEVLAVRHCLTGGGSAAYDLTLRYRIRYWQPR